MFTPQFLLYGLAVIALVFSLPGLVNPKQYRKEVIKMAKDEKIVRTYGTLILFIGFFFLSVQWKFESINNWMIIIPVLGWLTILKGIIYTWFPEFVERKVKIFFSKDSRITLWAILGTVIAVALAYIAMNYIAPGEIVAG